MLIDTHCHLDFPAFDSDRDLVVTACKKQNITSIIVPGVCSKHWQRILLLCRQYDFLYPALGLHPCYAADHQEQDLQKLAEICAQQSIVAIGEIGLDYYMFDKSTDKTIDKELQSWYFTEQLKIARQYDLPVLIHARKSHQDVIQYLKNIKPLTGIIHAFSGSYEQAIEYIKLGFKLGFGGAYTYPQATKLRALVVRLPIETWVLETDAPDMSPRPIKLSAVDFANISDANKTAGTLFSLKASMFDESPAAYHHQRNSPQYIPQIAQEFVHLYNAEISIKLTAQQILSQLNKNTHEVLTLI